MLALLDEPVAIVQAAEESDDLGEHQFNVLVRLAHAILRQIVVDVVGEVLWRQAGFVQEVSEGFVAASFEFHIRVEAVRNLLVHLVLEVQARSRVLDGVLDVLFVFDDGLASFNDVGLHLFDDAGQVGFTSREAAVQKAQVVGQLVINHVHETRVLVDNLLVALRDQLLLDGVHEGLSSRGVQHGVTVLFFVLDALIRPLEVVRRGHLGYTYIRFLIVLLDGALQKEGLKLLLVKFKISLSLPREGALSLDGDGVSDAEVDVEADDGVNHLLVNDVLVTVFGELVHNFRAHHILNVLRNVLVEVLDCALTNFLLVAQVKLVEVAEHTLHHEGEHGVVVPLLDEYL